MNNQLHETQPGQQRSSAAYSVKLEALRGLAALMVYGSHCFPWTAYPWMHIPFNGSAAVSLFFVLSGYVLGLSLRRGRGTILRQYLLFQCRRVFRIYPAYVVTGLLFLIYWKLYPFAGEIGPLSHLRHLQLSTIEQLKNFFFLNQSLNNVTWSLKVEMIGSLTLPILHFLSRRWRWPGRTALLFAMMLLCFVPSSGSSRQRLFMFYLGYLVVDLEHLPKLSKRTYTAITGVCVVTFLTALLLGRGGEPVRLELLIEAVSAAGIILCIQSGEGSLGGLLNYSWSHFAGRISFSVFLVHQLFVDAVMNLLWLSPLKPITENGLAYFYYWLGLAISIPLVFLAAWGLYRWIEIPFINMGKSLGSVRAVSRPNRVATK